MKVEIPKNMNIFYSLESFKGALLPEPYNKFQQKIGLNYLKIENDIQNLLVKNNNIKIISIDKKDKTIKIKIPNVDREVLVKDILNIEELLLGDFTRTYQLLVNRNKGFSLILEPTEDDVIKPTLLKRITETTLIVGNLYKDSEGIYKIYLGKHRRLLQNKDRPYQYAEGKHMSKYEVNSLDYYINTYTNDIWLNITDLNIIKNYMESKTKINLIDYIKSLYKVEPIYNERKLNIVEPYLDYSKDLTNYINSLETAINYVPTRYFQYVTYSSFINNFTLFEYNPLLDYGSIITNSITNEEIVDSLNIRDLSNHVMSILISEVSHLEWCFTSNTSASLTELAIKVDTKRILNSIDIIENYNNLNSSFTSKYLLEKNGIFLPIKKGFYNKEKVVGDMLEAQEKIFNHSIKENKQLNNLMFLIKAYLNKIVDHKGQ